MSNDAQPRASTTKEIAEPRNSSATSAFYDTDPHTLGRTPVLSPIDLRRPVTPQPADDKNVLSESTSNLAKLQTYMPTGTWVMYTALETWAFSLRPSDPPISATSNCNTHQRIALYIVLGLSAAFAFLSSFVKRFVYDAEGEHVLYPPPDLFNVSHPISDPVTGVRFPCRTKEKRYCWPFVNNAGELVYDEKGLRVLVFKRGIKVHVRRKSWCKRVWRRLFHPEEAVPEAPQLTTSPISNHMFLLSNSTRPVGRDVMVEIDDVLATAPALQPRWSITFVGSAGSKAYVDFRPCVWAHALVSVFAFLTLALFSTQVTGCIYPSIPDYLPGTLQTGMLILLGLIAAVFLRDKAVSLGQAAPRTLRTHSLEGADEVPAHLRAMVEMVVWVRGQNGLVVR